MKQLWMHSTELSSLEPLICPSTHVRCPLLCGQPVSDKVYVCVGEERFYLCYRHTDRQWPWTRAVACGNLIETHLTPGHCEKQCDCIAMRKKPAAPSTISPRIQSRLRERSSASSAGGSESDPLLCDDRWAPRPLTEARAVINVAGITLVR